MDRKLLIFTVGIVLVGITALVITGQIISGGSSSAQDRSSEVPGQIVSGDLLRPLPKGESIVDENIAVPDGYVYGRLFRQIAAFYAKADEVERDGGDGGHLRNHFKRIAGLDDDQAYSLDKIAGDYIRESVLINARQRALVEAYRAQYPGGQVPHGQRRAPEPPELREIGPERGRLYLRMRDELRNAFGDEAFGRFDGFLRRRITPTNTKFFTVDPDRLREQMDIQKEQP